MSNTALQKSATGCVIHGGVRDSAQILELGFPCSASSIRRSARAAVRWEITDFGVPIRVGGVDMAAAGEKAPAEEVCREETLVRGAQGGRQHPPALRQVPLVLSSMSGEEEANPC